MSRSILAVIAVLGVAILKTDVMACSYLPTPISKGVNQGQIQSVVIGTVTQVDTFSTQIRVETPIKSQPSAEILSLITTEDPSSSCFSPLVYLYDVDQRYLLMLPEETPKGLRRN